MVNLIGVILMGSINDLVLEMGLVLLFFVGEITRFHVVNILLYGM